MENKDNNKSDLDIESLKNAIKSLGETIAFFKESGEDSAILFLSLRSAVIKNFELSYELCWKYMQKWLRLNIAPDVVDKVSKKEFYRIAEQHGLIEDAKVWWDFHDARNSAVHTYSSPVASFVCDKGIEFLPTAQAFLKNLEDNLL